MEKKSLSLIILISLSMLGFAQEEKYSREYGKITQYELTMKEYEKDPDADAVILYNQGDYYFSTNTDRGNFSLCMEKKSKIKILKQSGVQYANFEIPIYKTESGWETIENIKATTYNMDNGFTQTKLETKNVFEEKINDDVRLIKIALSDVRAGSLIELNYTITTPNFFNMRRWYFQERIPVIFSNLRYRAIPYYEYTYILKGTNKLDIFNSSTASNDIQFGNLLYKEVVYNFGMNNLPAFKDEQFISSVDDYMININFQISKFHSPNGGKRDIMTTWPALSDELLKNDYFGKYIKNVEKQANNILAGVELENKSMEEKIETITDFVKSKFTWNGYNGKIVDNDLKEFLKVKNGNAANMNLLLIGLLKSAGIETSPVILSTRENGSISLSHPFEHFFDYVIAFVKAGDRNYLLDATEPLLYYSVLPDRCMNVNGLVVKPKSEEWITIQQKNVSQLQKNLQLKINPETNTIQADAMYLATGPDAYRLRTIYQGNAENLISYFKESENKDITIMKLPEETTLNKPFTFLFQFENVIDNNDNKMFINPFCALTINKNPFTQSTRTLPVDLVYLQGESYNSIIHIPVGYKVEYIPQNLIIDNELISFSYSTTTTDDRIVIDTKFNLKQYIINPKDYQKLKNNFNTIIKSLTDMVVFVKG